MLDAEWFLGGCWMLSDLYIVEFSNNSQLQPPSTNHHPKTIISQHNTIISTTNHHQPLPPPQHNTTSIVYTTQVLYSTISSSRVITRSNDYVITIACAINRSSSDDVSYIPQPRFVPPQTGNGVYDVTLLLFKVSHLRVAFG